MALGKKCGSKVRRVGVKAEDGLGFARYTRALGTKRIVVWDSTEASAIDSGLKTPVKKRRNFAEKVEEQSVSGGISDWSLLQSLPQDILIRVVCGVDHDDLRQLFHVSKSIREATLIAKRMHFAYSTPSKMRPFPSSIDFMDEPDEIKTPDAPKQIRGFRSRLGEKKLASISVALFASPDENRWPRQGLMLESEV